MATTLKRLGILIELQQRSANKSFGSVKRVLRILIRNAMMRLMFGKGRRFVNFARKYDTGSFALRNGQSVAYRVSERLFTVGNATQIRRRRQKLKIVRRDTGILLLKPLMRSLNRSPLPFRERSASAQKHSKLVIRMNQMLLNTWTRIRCLLIENLASFFARIRNDWTYQLVDFPLQLLGLL